MLNAAIRQRNTGGVKAALATGQVDATALATANTIAKQAGDAAVIAMVKTAADATPAVAPVPITVAAALLRSYEGSYQNAVTGAGVKVAFDGTRLTLTADGQTPLRLQPIEERRFIADEAPELNVAFAGRGGIIERLSSVSGTSRRAPRTTTVAVVQGRQRRRRGRRAERGSRVGCRDRPEREMEDRHPRACHLEPHHVGRPRDGGQRCQR